MTWSFISAEGFDHRLGHQRDAAVGAVKAPRVLGGVQSSLQATTLDELVRFSQRADVEPTSDAAPTAA